MSNKKLRRTQAPKFAPIPAPTKGSTTAPIPAPAPPAPSASPAAVVAAIEQTLEAVRNLSAQRLEARLSVARLTGVARELRELLKVMSVYGV